MPLTNPEVFIIESLPDADPHDGKVLFDILTMMGKKPIYREVKDADDFEVALEEYKVSQYRFLHISCHGNESQIAFKNGMVDYLGFGNLFANHRLPVTRIFFSACCLGNPDLAKAIISSNTAIHSVTAPRHPIAFTCSLVSWSVFYTKAFNWNENGISEKTILMTMRQISNLMLTEFNVSSLHTETMKIHTFAIIPEKHILKAAQRPSIIEIPH